MLKNLFKNGISLRFSLGFVSVGMVVATAVLLGGMTYWMTQSMLRETLRTRMADMITVAAQRIDPALHRQVQNREDEGNATYLTLKSILKEIRNISPDIRFLYTCRRNAQGHIVFIVDAEESEAEISHVGDVYNDASPLLLRAFDKPFQTVVEKGFTTDKWGTFLSSYAPILSADGEVEAVIGMDMTAMKVIEHERDSLYRILFMLILCGLLGMWVSMMVTRRIAHSLLVLDQDLQRIQNLDLSGGVPANSQIREIVRMEATVETIKNSLRSFRKYVPADLVSELIALRQEAVLGAEPRNITLFFSDIAGFTTISEQLEPGVLAERLGVYFAKMTGTILGNKGTVDKFIGDAVMAFWGAPRDNDQHAVFACRTALLCQRALDELAKDWQPKGYPLFSTRIGICTGVAIVGNIGTTERLSYTALGDVVNLASRLEGLNKFFQTRILIGESTHALVQETMATRLLGVVAVKGKVQGVRVYELVDEMATISPEMLRFLQSFNAGMTHYLGREWEQAIPCFDTCLELIPGDEPSRQARQECEALLRTPPAEDWNGTIVMHEK